MLYWLTKGLSKRSHYALLGLAAILLSLLAGAACSGLSSGAQANSQPDRYPPKVIAIYPVRSDILALEINVGEGLMEMSDAEVVAAYQKLLRLVNTGSTA